MTTYEIIHDRISPTADRLTFAELRDYMAERHAEDPEAGWQDIADSLQVTDSGIVADLDGAPTAIARAIADSQC